MQTADELLQQAQALNEAKKYDEVIALLTDDVLREYKNADLYAEVARAYYRTKKKELCEKAVNDALAINPNQAKANHYRGNIFWEAQKYVDAIEAYNSAIKTAPDFALPYYGLGNVYNDQKKYEEAINAYNQAIKIDPNFAFPYNGLGNAYKGQKKYDEAINAYNQAIKIDPNYVWPYNGLGYTYFVLKKYDEAIYAYNQAIKIDPNFAYPYNGLGNTYREQKKYEEAIYAYNQAIKIDLNFAYPYNGLGNTYKEQQKYDDAINAYKQAIKIDPTYDAPYYNLGSIYDERKQYNEALKYYEKKIELSSINSDIYALRAQKKVAEIKKLLASAELSSIKKLVDKIKELLLHNDGCVTHYTSLSVTQQLILYKSPFRLSEGAFLNDTAEGTELFNFLNFHSVVKTEANAKTEAKLFTQKPFIGSFVDKKEDNSLALWRMYAKENKDEAKGCAITINTEKWCDFIKKEFATEKKGVSSNELDEHIKFYQVAYRTQSGSFIIPGALQAKNYDLNTSMKELEKCVDTFNEKIKKNQVDETSIKDVQEMLNNIAYLFKTSEYQYEHELRLVVKNDIAFEKKFLPIDKPNVLPKVYIELTDITPFIISITLGPKVEHADEWAALFHYTLAKDKLPAEEVPKIYISHLPFK